MTSGSVDPSGLVGGARHVHELEGQLDVARAERDAAVARLDKRGRRQRRRESIRRTVVAILAILVAILIPVTVTATWAHRTVLNTIAYVSTVAPIAEDPAVTSTLARIATDQIFTALNPQATITAALPPQAAFLAEPIANGVKGFIQDKANAALNSEQFRQLWVNANRRAHASLVKVLHGDSKAVVTENGQVVLDMVPLLNQVLQGVQQTASDLIGKDVTLPQLTGNELPSAACAKISAVLDRPLPATCGQIALFPADKLDQAQWAVRVFDRAVLALLILTPLLAIVMLLLSHHRRRTLLQAVIGTMLVMVVMRRAMFWLQKDLTNTGLPANKAARTVIVQDLLHGFFTASVWVLAVGLAIAVVALLTGPYRWAVQLREWVRSGVVALLRPIRSAAGRQAAGAWINRHVDAMRIAGGVVALLLLLVFEVSFVWLLIILAVLAAYEFWLYRIGAANRSATRAAPKLT